MGLRPPKSNCTFDVPASIAKGRSDGLNDHNTPQSTRTNAVAAASIHQTECWSARGVILIGLPDCQNAHMALTLVPEITRAQRLLEIATQPRSAGDGSKS